MMRNKKSVEQAWDCLRCWVKSSKPQHSEIILSLQYCKPVREQNTNIEEWLWCLRIKANRCGYKEEDRRLKEQLINGKNDDMITGIMRTDSNQKDKWNHYPASISMDQDSRSTKYPERLTEATKENKDFDTIQKKREKEQYIRYDKAEEKCISTVNTAAAHINSQRWPTYGRSCWRFRKLNHFEWLWGARATRCQRMTKTLSSSWHMPRW